MIQVGRCFSVAAAKASYWLPTLAGSDVALLLTSTHVILAEQLQDAGNEARQIAQSTGFTDLPESWSGLKCDGTKSEFLLIEAARDA